MSFKASTFVCFLPFLHLVISIPVTTPASPLLVVPRTLCTDRTCASNADCEQVCRPLSPIFDSPCPLSSSPLGSFPLLSSSASSYSNSSTFSILYPKPHLHLPLLPPNQSPPPNLPSPLVRLRSLRPLLLHRRLPRPPHHHPTLHGPLHVFLRRHHELEPFLGFLADGREFFGEHAERARGQR